MLKANTAETLDVIVWSWRERGSEESFLYS